MQIASFDRWITQFHILYLRFDRKCDFFPTISNNSNPLYLSVNNEMKLFKIRFYIRKYHMNGMNDTLQIAFSFECFHLGNFLLGLKAIKRLSQLLWLEA